MGSGPVADGYARQSGLAHLQLMARAVDELGSAGIGLAERTPRAQIALRGPADDRAFVEGFAGGTGLELPVQANRTASALGRTVFWLGPDEWLLTSTEELPEALTASLAGGLSGCRYAMTDVSESRVAIRVQGPHLAALMSKVTSLDLDRMAEGACAQSTFARTHMLLHALPGAYDIYVHRSFADYAWHWLEDAAQEYGVAVLR